MINGMDIEVYDLRPTDVHYYYYYYYYISNTCLMTTHSWA